jgi:glyoxylase-like metal-dependent hydrolase (beta-lactamase superfamily II)
MIELMTRTFHEVRALPRAVMVAGALLLSSGGVQAAGQQEAAPDALEVLQIRDNFFVIAGDGSNIAVQLGPDGAVIVDTGTGARAVEVIAEIRKLTSRPIRYIINTSADPDHVGGNDELSAAGESVIPTGGLNEIGAAGGRSPILAEENVQSRMAAPTGETSAFPIGAWPTVTYSSALDEVQKDLYINGEAIVTLYQPAAHSDGDSIVFFRRSDVLVTGDVFDQTRFPVIDLEKGGSVQGVIDSLNRIIGITVPPVPFIWQDGGTVVVPGHGIISHEADVVDYRDMVTIVRDRIQAQIAAGLTLTQIRKTDPVKGFRGRYGSDTGSWTTDQFIEAVYTSLGGDRP